MSYHPLIVSLMVLAAAKADPEAQRNKSELEVSGQRVLDIDCSLLEGEALALPALRATLEGKHPALTACAESTDEVLIRVQWSWGGRQGATIVVTDAPSAALADCIEATLEPRIADIVGYCVALLPLSKPALPASASTPL